MGSQLAFLCVLTIRPVTELPLQARRVFRLAGAMALALAVAYGMGAALPFLAPVFALLLTATPGPPLGLKGLASLSLAVLATFGLGLALAPMLISYPVSAVLIAAVGIYVSSYLAVNMAKGLVATLLVMGITMVSAAGTVSTALAAAVIGALIVGIGIAVVCQAVVYALFPEDPPAEGPAAQTTEPGQTDDWIALRATLVVLPAYLLALTNPALFLPVIVKSALLGQQASAVALRDAGRELLGSTALAGILAIGFWCALGISVNLWMFSLWMLLVGICCASRLYGVAWTRFTPSFWQNVLLTMLILLGSAVQDSASGKDVYEAFVVRMSLFTGVTLYAWFAVLGLEWLKAHLHSKRNPPADASGNLEGA